MSSVETSLNAGKFGSGIKALKKFIAKKSDGGKVSKKDWKAARSALKKVEKYGESQYETALRFAEDAYYVDALRLMQDVGRAFKGTELGDQAKDKSNSWKKDKSFKAELKAGALHDRAKDLIRKKQYKDAAAFLKRLLKSRSLAETKTRVRAEETYRGIRQYL